MEFEEKDFFKDSNVLITQSRFVCLDKTYAMRNISSVSIGTIRGRISGWLIIFLFLAIIIAFANDSFVFGVIFVLFLFLYMYFGQPKDKYIVRINSNSGEVNALESLNKEYIQKVVDALNNAIIYRG